MVDLSDKISKSEVMNNSNQTTTTTPPERVSLDGTHLKTCADCGTTKTPLWRGGPAGPKSLCNACGIRSRKKRRALLGLNNKEDNKRPKKSTINYNNGQNNDNSNNNNASSSSNNSSSSGENSSNSNSKSKSRLVDISLKRKLLTFGRDVALQRPRSSTTSQRRKLGEEEQAAFLLMALSCGSVYA